MLSDGQGENRNLRLGRYRTQTEQLRRLIYDSGIFRQPISPRS